MAKYLLEGPAYINGQYIHASAQNPVVCEFSDSLAPSLSWKPMDKAAVAALKAQFEEVTARVKQQQKERKEGYSPAEGPRVPVLEPVEAPKPAAERHEPDTMSEMSKRASDRSPV